jgi:hypothetical protein
MSTVPLHQFVKSRPIGTVHDYKSQNGSPEEEAGWTRPDSSETIDQYGRYPIRFPSLWQLALREGAPEWIDLAASGVSELVACFLFSVVVNQSIAFLRIDGGLLGSTTAGVLIGCAAGFMAFILTGLLGHHSVRLNPAILFAEFFMPHHWGTRKMEGINGSSSQKGSFWGWNALMLIILAACQFVGYYLGTLSQNYITSGTAPLTGVSCADAAIPVVEATLTTGRAFAVEAIGAGIVTLAFFCSSLESKGSFNVGPMRSWVIGGAHFAATIFAYGSTTAIFNPFRYLASYAVLGTACSASNNSFWTVYTLPAFIAAALSALIFVFVARKTSLDMAFGKLEKASA